jgi:hypothetical protein
MHRSSHVREDRFLSDSSRGKALLMRSLLVAITLVQVSSAVLAQTRPSTTALTCAQAQGFVAIRTSLLMNTGPSTYDTSVSGPIGCSGGNVAEPSWVRTRDHLECALYTCRGRQRPG